MFKGKDEKNNEVEDAESYQGVGSFLWEIVKVFFWAFIIIVPIRVFLFQPFFVQGASMEPNFHDGDYLIINELGYKRTDVGFDNFNFFTVDSFRELERGDIIVFRYPKNPKQFFIKRIVGLPGESIEVKNGEIKATGGENSEVISLDEKEYIADSVFTSGTVKVDLSEEEYFVMGDNRQFSHDSRAWGPITKDDVIGKVLLRTWPIKNIDVF